MGATSLERARAESVADVWAGELEVIELAEPLELRGQPGDGAAAERARLGEHLRAQAAGDRDIFEDLRVQLLQEMHRPGDRAATAARLRVVEAVLAVMPRAVEDPWTWQQRVRRRRRGRWRR